jgi:hypothetical protein
MPKMAPQNERTKAKKKVDEDKLDPKELPDGDTTSSIGEKNVVGVHGKVGEEGQPETDADDATPFVR